MHIRFLLTGIVAAALAVLLGAFGAHALKQSLTQEALSIFETGVRYQMYHAFALLATGMLYASFPNRKTIWAGRCFTIGIIIFSGSLYALSLLMPNYRIIGAITPLGGMSFITGWFLMFLSIIQHQPKS